MSYNYKSRRLIFFTDSQYGVDNKNKNGSVKPIRNANGTFSVNENMKDFFNVNTHGYVLAPQKEIYLINQISNQTYLDDCVNEMCNFIISVAKANARALFWIGTPFISSNNGFSLPKDKNRYDKYLKIYIKYVNSIKKILEKETDIQNKNIWNVRVRGFYYNQESIYTDDKKFDYNNLGNNDEILLINQFSYYVHNSIPSAPGSSTSVAINKDLIWAPYLPVREQSVDNDEFEGHLFKKIGKVIEATTCFDCAFIQPKLTPLYSHKKNPDNSPFYNYKAYAEGVVMPSNVSFLKFKGIQNIKTICSSMDIQHLLYRDGVRVVADSEIPSKERECSIGAVYELNGDCELSNDPVLSDYSLFAPYSDFDSYVDTKPMLFYWQGESLVSKVCDTIERKYNQNETGEISQFTVPSSATDYLSALKSTMYYRWTQSLIKNINTPANTSTMLNIRNCNYTDASIPNLRNTISNLFRAQYPMTYWVDSLSVAPADYDGDYINNVSVTVSSKMNLNTENDNYNSFNARVNSIVSSLSANTDEPMDLFINAHNWLVDNVSYVANSSNSYHNCAYGALMPNIATATSKGFSKALTLLCQKLGVPCVTIIGSKNGETHYWNCVKLSDKWWFVDVSLNVPTSVDAYKYKYFLRTKPNSYFDSGILPKVDSATGNLVNYGDADGNGIITANDVSYVQAYVAGQNVKISPLGLIAADIDGNGIITSNDAACISVKMSNGSYSFPIEEKIKNYN